MPNADNTPLNYLDLFKAADIHRNGNSEYLYLNYVNIDAYNFSEQMWLYTDFILSSFPYLHMNSTRFALAISDQMPNWTHADCLDLFR